jgi:hypothetical protein
MKKTGVPTALNSSRKAANKLPGSQFLRRARVAFGRHVLS